MIKNVKLTDYGLEGVVRFELFKRDIDVLMDANINMDYANLCVQALNNLQDEVIEKLCESTIKYSNDFYEKAKKEKPKFDNLQDVLEKIYPLCLVIEIPKDKDVTIVHLQMGCEWEKEHGLEWIIRDDKVLYVGPFDCEYPDKSVSYFEKLTSNYVFN